MMAYQTSVHESTGCTPFYLMFGQEGHLPANVVFHLTSSPMQVNRYTQDMWFRLEQALSACSQSYAAATATSEGSI